LAAAVLNLIEGQKYSMYCPMPIYHSAGGAMGLGIALQNGAKFVMREKFSASNYFKDCAEHDCKIGQYIGEMVKYLNATPPNEYDRKHSLQALLGNGCRKEDWLAAVKRFNIPRIIEFYGATEGNANMVNQVNKPGACGYFPWLIRKLYPAKIVSVDENDEVVRNKKGLCTECKSGEVGHLVGLIKNDDPTRRFDGYSDKKATEKKILRDVFKKGDQWFASGDLMKREGPYYYFVDRIGDTFRWKGENCSTREIESVIEKAPVDMKEVNVYGVQIKNTNGRAGMACIGLEDDAKPEEIDFGQLYQTVKKGLASYQRPIFLRIKTNIELTSTFKHKKVGLRNEGFDPSLISDPLFFIDNENETYVPLDEKRFNSIQNGEIKL